MKKSILIAAFAMGVSLFGADYSAMSTEELINLRGTLPVNERASFREELQKRVKDMSVEDKQKYNLGRGLGGQGKGRGLGQGRMLQDGSGGGAGR